VVHNYAFIDADHAGFSNWNQHAHQYSIIIWNSKK
jgi:hypothetical protein